MRFELFTIWMKEKLLPVLGNHTRRESRSIIILNNAKIHHSNSIVSLIESVAAMVLYNTPYSSDLNPIKLMFGLYKYSLKCNIFTDWINAHIIFFQLLLLMRAHFFVRARPFL